MHTNFANVGSIMCNLTHLLGINLDACKQLQEQVSGEQCNVQKFTPMLPQLYGELVCCSIHCAKLGTGEPGFKYKLVLLL